MRYSAFKLALAISLALSVFSFAQIPVIKITTEGNKEVGSGSSVAWGQTGGKQNYVRITNFELSGTRNGNFDTTRISQPDSIRVRGNSTAQAAKKPYRIKFDKKVPMFGRKAAKSWVLLAEFYDGTFALNAIAFRLGKKMGLEFTNSTEFVEVHINNQNKGIYHLTEQLQVNPGRVDIDEDKGWLVEIDYHEAEEGEIKFKSTQYSLNTRIKSPEVESNFSVDNPKVSFVRDDINALCDKMAASGFPENGYRDLIDLESWVKYVLIQQFMDNFDFNLTTGNNSGIGSNYAYKDVGNRIKAGPLWDFDLSASVIMATFPKHYQTYQRAIEIESRNRFYRRLWDDPAFKAKFKKTWDAYKSEFSASVINAFVDSISSALSSNLQGNIWGNNALQGSAALTAQVHGTEVTGLKNWWSKRYDWFDEQLTKMNIDVSKDVIQPPLEQQSLTFTVSFNLNSSSAQPKPDAQTVAEGEKATKPADMTRNGYTFDGWYKDADFTTPWNFDSDIVSANTTLYAKWADSQEVAPIIKNGLAINAASSVYITVFNLKGNVVSKQIFNKGNHTIKLDGLPKGLYIVKATYGNGASPVVFKLPVN